VLAAAQAQGRQRAGTASFVAVVLASSALLAACGSSSKPASSTGTTLPGGSGTTKVAVVISDDGCAPDPASVDAGTTEFDVENNDSAKVTEAELKSEDETHILGEKENITPGLSAKFTLKLPAGKYKMVCPGGKQDSWTFTVKGADTADDWRANPELVAATDGYQTWVKQEVDKLATNATAFATAVKAGNLDEARALYAKARLGYEAVEPVAEAFGNLDKAIDGRIDDFDNPAQFEGFHRLEKAIFVDNNVTGMATVADGLDNHIKQLQTLVATQRYTPIELASGATDLINEIQESKITGEEERYSGIDLVDFRGNLDGAMQVVDQFKPFLDKNDPALLAKINARNAVVETALAKYAANPGFVDSGYVKYSTVTNPERRELSRIINSLAESISEMVVVVTK
jgi:iron uptake system component EfeO